MKIFVKWFITGFFSEARKGQKFKFQKLSKSYSQMKPIFENFQVN